MLGTRTASASDQSQSWTAALPRELFLARLTGVVIIAPLAVLLLRQFVYFVTYVSRLLPLPFSLDYGEGIVLQQALLIPGSRMYGPIDHYPFIVFHYPPLYHVVVRMIAAIGFDPLLVGRALSVAATFA